MKQEVYVDTTNIYPGFEARNYRELCTVLGQDYKSGNAKKAQLNIFSCFFSYRVEGYKFIVEEIYDIPKGRNIDHYGFLPNIEELLLDFLASQNENDKAVIITKKKLLQRLSMTNHNYESASYLSREISNAFDIDENNIKNFCQSSLNTLTSALEAAFRSLKSRYLILWQPVTMVVEAVTKNVITYNEAGKPVVEEVSRGKGRPKYRIKSRGIELVHRLATEAEETKIINIAHRLMVQLGCSNQQELVAKGKWAEHKKLLEEEMLKRMNFKYKYTAYKILFNHEHIERTIQDIKMFELEAKIREASEHRLNEGVVKRLEDNLSTRLEKRKEPDSEFADILPEEPGYRSDHAKLIKLLISKDKKFTNIQTKDIRNISGEELDMLVKRYKSAFNE